MLDIEVLAEHSHHARRVVHVDALVSQHSQLVERERMLLEDAERGGEVRRDSLVVEFDRALDRNVAIAHPSHRGKPVQGHAAIREPNQIIGREIL